MTNEFTPLWFSTFLLTRPAEWTQFEIEAVGARLPFPEYSRVLDLGCGPGRIAGPLCMRGYYVTGIDRDPWCVEKAQQTAPSGKFMVLDLRDIRTLLDRYDAIISLWGSFGYFDQETNDRILKDAFDLLRPGGRMLIDIMHPEYFAQRPSRILDSRKSVIAISTVVDKKRLRFTIEYNSGLTEQIEFEAITPSEMVYRCERHGFQVRELCAGWESGVAPTPGFPRYAAVLEKQR